MTTDKQRLTVYLADRRPLDDMAEDLRRLAPLELRGQISRSTVIEAALELAWEDLQAKGRESAIARRMVTLPPAGEG